MELFHAKGARFYFKTITVIAVWRIYCNRARSVRKLLLLMQVRNEDGLNRVSSKGDGVARFGIHFKGRVARMSRECLPQIISFSLSLFWILVIFIPS